LTLKYVLYGFVVNYSVNLMVNTSAEHTAMFYLDKWFVLL